jgi:hypothetical protein
MVPIIGVEPTTFALRKRADSKMSTRMSMLKINFSIKYKYQKDTIKITVQRLTPTSAANSKIHAPAWIFCFNW